MKPIFITGTGTGVGKTLVSAILAEALRADYWKPVQAGLDHGTDSEWVASMLSNDASSIMQEQYVFKMAASPHLAASNENKSVDCDLIVENFRKRKSKNRLIIEGAGGLMVPLNENEFVFDLILKLEARVVLVSRNYLGSINHSLLTAAVCKQFNLDVAGWIFNDDYLSYEHEISKWSGYPILARVPGTEKIDKQFIRMQAEQIEKAIEVLL